MDNKLNMASNSEYEQRRSFEEIKWVSVKGMLPNPKTYKINTLNNDVKWFEYQEILDENGCIKQYIPRK